MKRQPRGPKCPVCKAVMHPGKDGNVACAFVDSHARIVQARLRQAQKTAEENRKKS